MSDLPTPSPAGQLPDHPRRSSGMRAGDTDREACAERLRAAYTEGRLSDGEMHDRLDAALRARTVAELTPLTADLPAPEPPPAARTARRPAAPAATRPPRGTPLRAAWGAWLLAVTVNLVIWVAVCVGTRQWAYFWPIWVAGPWGAVLLSRTVPRTARRCGMPPARTRC